MRLDIVDVYFPDAVRDKVYAREIDEGMVQGALTADPDMGDDAPLLVEGWEEDDGAPDLLVLARDPSSGVYLELGVVLEVDGLARCYHAMRMRDRDRRRFRAAGG